MGCLFEIFGYTVAGMVGFLLVKGYHWAVIILGVIYLINLFANSFIHLLYNNQMYFFGCYFGYHPWIISIIGRENSPLRRRLGRKHPLFNIKLYDRNETVRYCPGCGSVEERHTTRMGGYEGESVDYWTSLSLANNINRLEVMIAHRIREYLL